MTTFKDICAGEAYTAKDGSDKMKWTKVGSLIEKDGKQYVKMHLIPMPKDGGIFLSVFEQQERQAPRQQSDPFGDAPF